jgi:hypothetical protein
MTVSVALSEALRAEIRTALEADGKPFSIAVARRVYDIAIAARDLLVTASGNSVGSAIEAVEDAQGPLDNISGPSATPAPSIVAETYGARMIRELLAALPMLRGETQSPPGEDPKALVHALAEARRHGMNDIGDELERKLFGRVLTVPKMISDAPPDDFPKDSFEQGFVDGQDGLPPDVDTSEYKAGYQEGVHARYITPFRFEPPRCSMCAAERSDRKASDCELRKAKALKLTSGECIRVVAGGPFERWGQKAKTLQREFRVCSIGGAGKAASIQISTPDIPDPDMPGERTTRKILVGDVNKMCRFGWPQVSYESDLEPYKKNVKEIHGRRRSRSRRKRSR